MEKAVILISFEASLEHEALSELRKIAGVTEAHFLYGPYDAYAMVEAETSQQLQDIVINNIRDIEGIKTTVTCFMAD